MANIAGIDLGTTFSAIAVLNKIGKSEIMPNAEGERITPSAIFFDEADGEIIRVGLEALNSHRIDPDRSVRWIKRHIGQTDYCKNIDGTDWGATELSSLILRKLKQDCATGCGSVADAVISVPAHFDEVRRKATMDAGTMAGLNVIGIINEPVAAALFYATTNNISGRVMVYDLGGGTFDVTVLDIQGQKIDIVCSQGDHALGGIDFDRIVLEKLESAYREKFKQELIASDQDRARYEDEAEDIKKTLSRRQVAKKMLYGPAGSMRFELSRAEFEEAISSLIARTNMLVEVALKEADSSAKDISKILLVGGSTRIPLIHRTLEKKFGSAPEVAVNVDECVALGAAIYAGLTKMRDEPDKVSRGVVAGLKDVKLKDVCNHSYGTICAPKDEETGKYVIRNSIILKKNTPLPCEASRRFYTMVDGQTELSATITQGEDSDPDYVNKIAEEVFNLPPDRYAKRPICVTYSYDTNQRMHCTFKDEESERMLEVDFCVGRNGELSPGNIESKAEKLQELTVQ